MIVLYSEHKNKEVLHHDPKNHPHRPGKMQRLRRLRRRLPRGRHRHGGRQGPPPAGRLLRRPGRLPARLPHRGHHLCGAGGRRLRREGGGGQPQGQGHARPRRLPRCPGPADALAGGRCPRRCGRPGNVPAGAVALPDQTGPGERPLVRRGEAAGGGGLRRLCLCVHAPGFHAGQNHPHRLPQAGRRGLQRKADTDPGAERHSERHRGAHGGALLRRAGTGGEKGPAGQRQVHPLAGGDPVGGRPGATDRAPRRGGGGAAARWGACTKPRGR